MFADIHSHNSGGMGKPHDDAVMNYLDELERALRGADSALIHDALIDAETHLRAAIAAGTPAAAAIEEFGTPSDIALAYFREQLSAARGGAKEQVAPSTDTRESTAVDAPVAHANSGDIFVSDAPARVAPPASFLRRIPIIGIYFDPYAWGAMVFLTFGFVLALAAFVWVMVLGSLAIGLLPTLLGIPLFIVLLGSARGISLFFGKVIEALVGIRMPRRAYRVDVSGVDGFWRRLWLWIKDIHGWLTVGFLIGNFPIALFFFSVIVSLLAASISLLAIGIGGVVGHGLVGTVIVDEPCTIHVFNTPYVSDENGMFHVPFHVLALLTMIGFALLTATLWLSKGVAFVYAQVVKAIQVVRPQSLSQQ